MNEAKAAYTLGLRLKQLSLSLRISEGYDLSSAMRYCGLASAAYATAKPLLDSNLVYPQGVDGLKRIHQTLDFASNPNHDFQPDISNTHADIHTVIDVCQSYLENRGLEFSTSDKWFRVGLQMATVGYEEFRVKRGKKTQNKDKYCNWTWENKSLIFKLLSDLHASFDRLFPIDKVEEHDVLRKRDLASQMESPAGWIFLEIGLDSYWEPAPPTRKRKCYQRDHTFLEWFEAENGSNNSRYRIIAKRWSTEHSESKVTSDVVKRGIFRARNERVDQ